MVVTRPLFSDDMTICSSGFIVNNLEVNPVDASLEAGHNLVLGINVMTISIRLEGLYVNRVAVAVVGEHAILIPATRYYG